MILLAAGAMAEAEMYPTSDGILYLQTLDALVKEFVDAQ